MRKYMDVLGGALLTLKPLKGRAVTTGRINPFRLFGLYRDFFFLLFDKRCLLQIVFSHMGDKDC